MKEDISAMLDGEVDAREFDRVLAALREPGDALETWRSYHLISDAMRDTNLVSEGFAARVMSRIADEPTVIAPASAAANAAAAPAPSRPRLFALSAAASVAAVALVGWVALAPQPGADSAIVASAPPKPAVAAVKEPAAVPLTTAADDYLLAHQAYSPRNGFQGVAPYVRTVATRQADVPR